MKKWSYGDSWEKFPIRAGELWQVGTGRAAVHNLFNPLPEFVKEADMLFIDPPWNLGNLNSFYTKAGRTDYQTDFGRFADRLFECITEVAPATCYIEIGRQNVDDWTTRLAAIYPTVTKWDVFYYRKFPTHIIRGSRESVRPKFDLTNMDEADCISLIAQVEKYGVIGDLCMGRGLLGVAAFKNQRRFVGTELNRRRLACLLDKVHSLGGEVCKL